MKLLIRVNRKTSYVRLLVREDEHETHTFVVLCRLHPDNNKEQIRRAVSERGQYDPMKWPEQNSAMAFEVGVFIQEWTGKTENERNRKELATKKLLAALVFLY